VAISAHHLPRRAGDNKSGNQCASPAPAGRRYHQWQSVRITCPGGPEISPKRIACRGRCDGRATAAAAAAAAAASDPPSAPPSAPPSPPPSTSTQRGGTGQRQTLLKERRHRHSSSVPPPAAKRAWRCGERLHAKGAQAQALELDPPAAQYGASSDAIKAIKGHQGVTPTCPAWQLPQLGLAVSEEALCQDRGRGRVSVTRQLHVSSHQRPSRRPTRRPSAPAPRGSNCPSWSIRCNQMQSRRYTCAPW
jgi:hypothetical protein